MKKDNKPSGQSFSERIVKRQLERLQDQAGKGPWPPPCLGILYQPKRSYAAAETRNERKG